MKRKLEELEETTSQLAAELEVEKQKIGQQEQKIGQQEQKIDQQGHQIVQLNTELEVETLKFCCEFSSFSISNPREELMHLLPVRPWKRQKIPYLKMESQESKCCPH